MTTRVVIAGCRNYCNYDEAKIFLDECLSEISGKIIILSGGSKGADRIGERYATENGIEIELFLPEWNKYGKGAGPKRNLQMAEASDFVICFWDKKSSGTKSMIEYAKLCGKPLKVKII